MNSFKSIWELNCCLLFLFNNDISYKEFILLCDISYPLTIGYLKGLGTTLSSSRSGSEKLDGLFSAI